MEPRKKSHKKAKVPKEKVIEQHVAKNKRKREVNKADRERERKESHQRARVEAGAKPVKVVATSLTTMFRPAASGEGETNLATVMRNIRNNHDTHWTRQESDGTDGRKRQPARLSVAPDARLKVDEPTAYRRMHIEDIVCMEKEAHVLLKVPKDHPSLKDLSSPLNHVVQNHAASTVTQCGRLKSLYELNGIVQTNPYCESISRGEVLSREMYDLITQGEGFTLSFPGINHDIQFKWTDFHSFDGTQLEKLELWYDAAEPIRRSYYESFKNRRNADSREVLYGQLAQELEGDRLSLAILTIDKLRADKFHQELELKKKMQGIESLQATLSGPEVTKVLEKVNDACKAALEGSYGTYCILSEPILSLSQLDNLVEYFRVAAPSVHAVLSRLLGFEIRVNNARKQLRHDVEQRTLLCTFISLCRVRNNSNAIFWAMARYASGFARSEGEAVQRIESFFGLSVSRTTWERRSKDFATTHEKRISNMLRGLDHFMFAFDNSQAGQKMKDQREGSCTSFWEATTEVLKQLHEFVAPPEVEVMYSRPMLTYVDQRIPSPLGMPPYERATTFDDTIAVLKDPKKWEYYDKSDTSIDSTGARMTAYIKLLRTAQVLQCIQQKGSLEDKRWAGMPKDHAESQDRKSILTALHKVRSGLLRMAHKFQQKTVKSWNPFAELADAFAILPLSSRIEGTIFGAGTVLLDFLVLSGLLIEETNPVTKRVSWKAAPNVEEKWVYVVGDLLSLDNLNAFIKMLHSSKVSFDECYRQILDFEKALSRIVPIPGDLHVRFHTLGPIFRLYYGGFLQPIQTALGWKRLKLKVSECFQLAQKLFELVFGEVERVLLDCFEVDKGRMLASALTVLTAEKFAIFYARQFDCWFEDQRSDSHDELRTFLCQFACLGWNYKMLQSAIRTGDSPVIEYQIGWLKVMPKAPMNHPRLCRT